MTRAYALAGLAAALLAALAASPTPAQDADSGGPAVSRLAADRAFLPRRHPRFASARRSLDGFDAIRVDSRGRFVVSGSRIPRGNAQRDRTDPVMGVTRLLADGRVDRSFGDRGVAFIPLQGSTSGFAIDAQDRILLTGSWRDAEEQDFHAVRLTADGRLDTSFSEDGLLERSGQLADGWHAVVAAPDGSLVAAAVITTEDGHASFVVRVTPDGERDGEYGSGGAAAVPLGWISSISVDAQGRAVVGDDLGVVRLRADGSRDTDFGTGGFLLGPAGGRLRAYQLTHDAQGRIFVFGGETGVRLSVHRFLPDGAPDASFSEDGRADWVTVLPSDVRGGTFSLAVDPGGERLAVVGNVSLVDETLHFAGGGICLQSVDATDPDALGLFLERDPPPSGRRVTSGLSAAAFTGSSVLAVGGLTTQRGRRFRQAPLLMRVALTPRKPLPLPDLSVAWEAIHVERDALGAARVRAALRLRNDGDGEWSGGAVHWYLSSDTVLDASDLEVQTTSTGRVPAHGERSVVQFTGWLGGATFPHDPTGMHLLLVLNRDRLALEADTSNNVGASPAID